MITTELVRLQVNAWVLAGHGKVRRQCRNKYHEDATISRCSIRMGLVNNPGLPIGAYTIHCLHVMRTLCVLTFGFFSVVCSCNGRLSRARRLSTSVAMPAEHVTIGPVQMISGLNSIAEALAAASCLLRNVPLIVVFHLNIVKSATCFYELFTS